MKNWVRQALTRRMRKNVRGKQVETEIPPNEKVVWVITFSIASLGCLTALEIVHMIIFKTWNSEVFAAISGLIGTITGVFLGAKA